VRGTSATGMTGNDAKMEVNASTKVPTTDAVIIPTRAGIPHEPEV
jgi:hypothetical protein